MCLFLISKMILHLNLELNDWIYETSLMNINICSFRQNEIQIYWIDHKFNNNWFISCFLTNNRIRILYNISMLINLNKQIKLPQWESVVKYNSHSYNIIWIQIMFFYSLHRINIFPSERMRQFHSRELNRIVCMIQMFHYILYISVW